ncbi:hypothetical protein NPIL_222471 [Nephila pilipes]|uniref:Uncharacterized protein n=1 Tax=Nephila pilipes TaxID=299642 RepID=A0A8X6NHP0_NEPPI|nr:hypothetical protein NPIL_222471 [Nephila pilipes]
MDRRPATLLGVEAEPEHSTKRKSCLSTVSITPKRFKRKGICKPSISALPKPSPTDVSNISNPKIPEHLRPYWKSLLSEEFNPHPPAPSFTENNRYLPVLSPEDYFHKIKIQEYLFQGSEEGYISEYEPLEPTTTNFSQKREIITKIPLPTDHLKKK